MFELQKRPKSFAFEMQKLSKLYTYVLKQEKTLLLFYWSFTLLYLRFTCYIKFITFCRLNSKKSCYNNQNTLNPKPNPWRTQWTNTFSPKYKTWKQHIFFIGKYSPKKLADNCEWQDKNFYFAWEDKLIDVKLIII